MSTYSHCPLCGSPPNSGLSGLSDYWYCPQCSLGWQKKFPKSVYGENYYKGKSTFFSRIFLPIGNFFYHLRTSYAKWNGTELWIDVGAGDGGYLQTVSAKRKIGVEISSSGRKIMESLGLETMSEKEFLKSKRLRADVISFWHVLEHMDDPWKYLPVAYNNLQKNGVLVVGVPNLDSFELRLFKRHWFHLVPEHHYWFFSPKSIRLMLGKSGFAVQAIDYWSPEHHLTGILQSFINQTSGSDSVLHRLVKRREKLTSLSFADIISCLFWLTLGLPIVLFFWVVSSLFHRSGTMVIVAKKT